MWVAFTEVQEESLSPTNAVCTTDRLCRGMSTMAESNIQFFVKVKVILSVDKDSGVMR